MDNVKAWNIDSESGYFFKREVEQVRKKTYDVKKVPLSARVIFPLDHEIHEGAKSIVWQQYDMIGQARFIANYASDLPRVDIRGTEYTSKTKTMGDYYAYSYDDIRTAKMAGKPLDAKLGLAARKAIDILENATAFNGDRTHNIQGFFSNPSIPRFSVPANGSGDTEWSKKTSDEILEDLNFLGNYSSNVTNNVEKASTICIPVVQYNLIHSRKMGAFDTRTIAKAFLDASPYIKEIKAIPECQGAAYGDADMAFAYDKDPDKLQLIIPMEFMQHAAQEKGLEFQIPCEQKTGGVVVYYPMSVAFMEGI